MPPPRARRAFLPVLLVVLAMTVPAQAQEPQRLVLQGEVVVNGLPAPAGTRISFLGEGMEAARVRVEADGTYSAILPADDPQTPAREGLGEGAEVFVRALGAPPAPTGLRFSASATPLRLNLTFTLPDLLLEGLQVPAPLVDEGRPVHVWGLVRNAGRAPAAGVRVALADAEGALQEVDLGTVSAGAARDFHVNLSTAGLAGEQALRVSAEATNGDATPEGNSAFVAFEVVPDPAPRVVSVEATPGKPRAGERVSVEVVAQDDDGIALVRLLVEAEETLVFEKDEAPFLFEIGPFPAGPLRYRVEVVDSGLAAKTTRAPEGRLSILEGEEAGSDAPASPAPHPPRDAGVPPALLAAAFGGLLLVLAYLVLAGRKP